MSVSSSEASDRVCRLCGRDQSELERGRLFYQVTVVPFEGGGRDRYADNETVYVCDTCAYIVQHPGNLVPTED